MRSEMGGSNIYNGVKLLTFVTLLCLVGRGSLFPNNRKVVVKYSITFFLFSLSLVAFQS